MWMCLDTRVYVYSKIAVVEKKNAPWSEINIQINIAFYAVSKLLVQFNCKNKWKYENMRYIKLMQAKKQR